MSSLSIHLQMHYQPTKIAEMSTVKHKLVMKLIDYCRSGWPSQRRIGEVLELSRRNVF